MPATAKRARNKTTAAKPKKVTRRPAPARAGGQSVTARKPAASGRSVRKTEPPLMKALRAEHRHMSTVMQLFAAQLDAIEAGELVDPHVVYEIMHYMVSWPDRFHHPREDLIYARVAELDPGSADDVDTLQRDHDSTAKRGRAVLGDIERWRAGSVDGTAVIKAGRTYIDHIYEHMNVEEKLVFPRIEEVLSLDDWRDLAEDDELKAVSRSVFGPQVQREFRNLARKLRRNLRRGVERGTLMEWVGIEAFMESLEVVSIAYDSTLDFTSHSVRLAARDALGYFQESPLKAPLRCVANNTRVAFRLLDEVAKISRETLEDLARVNQERKDRVRLLNRNLARR